jgi:hypothetical protein
MKICSILVSFLALVTAVAVAATKEPFSNLREAALKIVQTEFPDAEFSGDRHNYFYLGKKIRNFTVYRPDKSGNWQKGREQAAPDRGGISVRFAVQRGEWRGALVVPYTGTDDLYIFKETHVIKNSGDRTYHIWAEILTPRLDAPDEIRNKLVTLFNDFDKFR